ncbi:MAG: riboflavin synthase [Candidatus Aminicenantes bacterium]|nr:riboflavin synthase [Candidatus Aminicenantes bacterium]
MFTGIVQYSGKFAGFRQGRTEMAVEADIPAGKIGPGSSVAVDGVCLTLVKAEGRALVFNLAQETLARTTLGGFRPGARLNLELPLTLADPLGGHLMSGHVDFTTKTIRVTPKRPGRRLVFALPAAQRKYFIPKGSVGVNGVSLTVASLGSSTFEVELIPVTLDKSNLAALRAGNAVNIECDMIGKYVYNFVSGRSATRGSD